MPTFTAREYHPESGALLGNISTLDFGTVGAGGHSQVKVIDLAFEGVSSVGNIKIGLVSSGGLTVAASGVEHFGITSSATFNSALASSPVSSHFDGVNGTGLSNDSNNVAIGSRSNVCSNYIYLDVEVGSTNLSAANGSYKIFLDYS
jgi:hypothetical protein